MEMKYLTLFFVGIVVGILGNIFIVSSIPKDTYILQLETEVGNVSGQLLSCEATLKASNNLCANLTLDLSHDVENLNTSLRSKTLEYLDSQDILRNCAVSNEKLQADYNLLKNESDALIANCSVSLDRYSITCAKVPNAFPYTTLSSGRCYWEIRTMYSYGDYYAPAEICQQRTAGWVESCKCMASYPELYGSKEIAGALEVVAGAEDKYFR